MPEKGDRSEWGIDGNIWSGEVNPDDARAQLDELLALLANTHRRDLLYTLNGRTTTSIDGLAQVLATHDAALDSDAAAIELDHIHLPKLADAGLVEYDRRSGVVRCHASSDSLSSLLDSCRSIDGAL